MNKSIKISLEVTQCAVRMNNLGVSTTVAGGVSVLPKARRLIFRQVGRMLRKLLNLYSFRA